MKRFGIIGLLLILSGIIVLNSCSSFGTRPNDKEILKLKDSKQYNSDKEIFENRRPDLIEEMKKKNFSFKLIKKWFTPRKNSKPLSNLPQIKPDLNEFMNPSNDLKVIWFGHSTFLLNMDGTIILVDPIFSGSAAPVSFMVKRFQPPVLKLEELPKIDVIVISHDHYDHLDMESIKYFKDFDIKFITPLGVGSHLKGWGVSEDKITERDWWESAKFGAVNFTATPAQHFSGRDGIHNNETLWASWVFTSQNHNIYFSGDSGFDTHFKEIGDRLGPFDVAFLENGQYNESWRAVHLLPSEGIQAFKDLRAKKFFPVHWGMFELSMHTWFEPIEKINQLTKESGIDLLAPKIGQVVNASIDNDLLQWWDSVVRSAD
jgi:L-ascorbate metabolism protein UlaG (beta-lactamase superfamily)